jgi:hypothetical protein
MADPAGGAPQDPNPDLAFSQFSGVKNTVGAERLHTDELARAINVDIDDVGQARRRRGYQKRLSGNFHSLFTANDGTIYGVMNDNLVLINPDFSTEVLQVGISSHLCWVQVGPTIYYSSKSDSGKIVQRDVVRPWGAQNDAGLWLSPVVNPTTNLAAIRGKLLKEPPLATCMTYYNGRLYLASGSTLWYTELYLYDYVDATKTFYQFEGQITMLGAVGDGIYVGTDEGLWFLQGQANPLPRLRVMDSAVIPGSMVDIPAELANPPQISADADTPLKISIAFLTAHGFCVAQDSGQAYNLTEAKFVFPDSVSASALWRRQDGVNQYVVVSDSGGGASSSARIGDYVDAEIIRAGTWLEVTDGVVFGDRIEATIV